MRYCLFDIALICSDELRERNFLIVDDEFIAFTDQGLDQQHDRTFAQVVRARFKADAQYPNPILAGATNEIESKFNLFAICLENSIEQWQFQILLLRFVKNGAKVLRQTRTTESKSRFKIIRRDI